MLNSQRWHHLDQLRGLAAVLVMLFHFDKWNKGYWDPNTFLGRMGVLAVTIFFILSGITLAKVYRWKLSTLTDFKNYAIRRVFRIFPLLWVATLATCILDGWTQPYWKLLINFTGLFGFISPGDDIALGAWSIGVELVFYTIFPMAVWCVYQYPKWQFWAFSIPVVLIGIIFATSVLSVEQTFESQYGLYTHWANHLYLFLAGIVINWLCDQRKKKKLILMYESPASSNFWHFVFTGAVCWIIFWPVLPFSGQPENGGAALIAGFNRIGLSFACMMICSAWHFGRITIPISALTWLGKVSYSLYLLHPLVYRCMKALIERYTNWYENSNYLWGLTILSIIFTLIVSAISYHWIEKTFMNLGKQCTPVESPS